MSLGLYVHIPFCEQHCHYCTFPIAVEPRSHHAAYMRRLQRELQMAALPTSADTVYLGGGTPSLVSTDLLSQLLDGILESAAEVSIEVNPGTLGGETPAEYRTLGINRISLGAQSFDEAELRAAGRGHSPRTTVRDFERLREEGFSNINMDLIAGLPGQSASVWDGNLDWIERLRPDHVSIYLLELEDSAFWVRHHAVPPPEEDLRRFYYRAVDRLAAIGYGHYEISNWSLPGKECRHNRRYWNGDTYRGIGLGAHSFMDGQRYWNVRSLPEYGRALDAMRLPILGSERRSGRVRVEEAFLLGLRQMDGVDVSVLAKDLQIDYPRDWFERMGQLVDAGLVDFDGSVVKLTRNGMMLATSVTEELLCPSLLSICEAIP